MTAGTKVTLAGGRRGEGRPAQWPGSLLFLRNSLTGAVEARDRRGTGVELNAALHDN